MPRKVDHQERRVLIADALMRVANERGLDEVSLRHVAGAAGVSAGMVQHYFRTKDEMMMFALAAVREHGQRRMTTAVEALGPQSGPRELLRTLCTEMLALDEPRRADASIGMMFQAYAAVRPAVAALLHDDVAATIALVATQIRAAQESGEAVVTIDPELAAVALLGMAEGMNYFLIGGHYDAATAVDALDAYLDTIFGPGRVGGRGRGRG